MRRLPLPNRSRGMRVLVIGSGGREHAVVRHIAKSPLAEGVFALPGNPGMEEALCLPGNPMDNDLTVRTALERGIDFCVVTPDDPLAGGLVDAMEAAGIKCFGPDRKAARIESSKAFSKGLMEKYGIPTARFAVFDRLDESLDYVRNQPLPLVVKADGLARGKGVVIAESLQEAEAALGDMLVNRSFGDSGSRVIVEEMLQGPEISLLALTDGETVVPLVSAMDHKRALDGDRGLNTGGMGAVAPNPYYTESVARATMETICLPTIRAMAAEGCPFKGCLFFGLMLTEEGPKVLEYNARFGDPEAQPVLELMESDLLSALIACREGTLRESDVRFSKRHACCVVLTSRGYPGSFETGFPIECGDVRASIHFAGVARREGRLVTAGGRVAGVTAVGGSLEEAIRGAYRGAEAVGFQGKTLRRDIGVKALELKGAPNDL